MSAIDISQTDPASPASPADAPRRAGRREWIGLGVLALACLVYAMDLTVLHLAVPDLSADLRPSSSQLLWIVDIYGFLVAGLLITMGSLGDRIGRRRLLLIGAAGFAAASVVAAFATSAEMLIAARALLGVAGATIAPSTLSLISSMFRVPAQRTFAIGIWITAFSAGGVVGPIFGGLLLEFFWWGSVFLLALPVMGLLLVLGPRLLPEFRDPDAGRIDLASAGLSLVSVLAFIWGVKRIAEHGLDPVAGLAILAGLALGALFVRRQTTLASPMIDLGLFRRPAFTAAMAAYAIAILAEFGAFLFIAQSLQLVHGLTPMEAGLLILPSMVGFILGSMLTPRILRLVSAPTAIVAGLLVGAAGIALLTQIQAGDGPTLLVISSIVTAFGLAPVFTLATDVVVGAAPPERAGAASAISETGAELGGALGIALLGSVGAAFYRSGVADAVPAGLSGDSAAAARDTLGGAVAASGEAPGDSGAGLLDAAREAFTEGFQVVAGVSTLLLVAGAVLTVVLLRRAGARSGASSEPAPEAAVVADGAPCEAC